MHVQEKVMEYKAKNWNREGRQWSGGKELLLYSTCNALRPLRTKIQTFMWNADKCEREVHRKHGL